MSPLSRGPVLLLLHTCSQQVMQGKLGLGSAHGSMVSLSWVRFAMSCSKLRTRFLLAKRTACKSSVARSQTRLAMADRVARCALLETATPKATLHHACARKPQTRNDAKMTVTRWRELVLNTTELPQFWSWPSRRGRRCDTRLRRSARIQQPLARMLPLLRPELVARRAATPRQDGAPSPRALLATSAAESTICEQETRWPRQAWRWHSREQ